MRITKYLIDIDLKCDDGKHLLINGANGFTDVIGAPEYAVLCDWQKNAVICAEGDQIQEALFSQMVSRGYIVEDAFDEEAERNRLIQKLVAKTAKKMDSCKNVCIIPTYDCNFSCPYCYEQKVRGTKRMSRAQVDKIFAINGDDIQCISFFGGEPLLPANMEIVNYVISKAPQASYSMITNGYYLEEYFNIFCNLRILNIQVTLDGPREVHNKTRKLKNGNGTFDKIMNGIKLYAEHKIPITVRMNITPANIQSCKVLKEYIYSFPWAEMIKIEMQPVFQVEVNSKNSLIEDMLLEDKKSLHKNELLKRQSPLANLLYNGLPLRPIIKSCDADNLFRYYDPEGNVYSCILAVGNPQKRIGTYGNASGNYVLESNSMLTRNISTIPDCIKCKYALICGGGCPNAIPDNMDMQSTPNCSYFMNEIKNEIPAIYKLRDKK